MLETSEEKVSQNIKAEIKRANLTQDELAIKLECTKQTINTIVNNPFNYSIFRISSLAKAIGCNIDQFFLKRNSL